MRVSREEIKDGMFKGLRVSPSKKHSHDNRPIFDPCGYAHGRIVNVTFHEARAGEDGRTYGPSYKWEFECPGTNGLFRRAYWTWLRVKPAKPGQPLSPFADLCLRLGLMTVTSMPACENDIDAGQAVGLTISYTFTRKDGRHQIVGDSVTPDKDAATQLVLW